MRKYILAAVLALLPLTAYAQDGAWMLFVHGPDNGNGYEGIMLDSTQPTYAACLVGMGRVQTLAKKGTYLNCVFLPFTPKGEPN